MVLTGRLKALLAVVVAIGAYILYTGGDDARDAPVGGAARAGHTALSKAGGPQGVAQSPDGGAPAGGTRAAGSGARNVSSAGSEESARLFAQLSHRVSEGSSAGALFKSTSWYTPPPPPPPVQAVVAPPPAPVAPPLPFTVMGSYARPGERTTYFLTRGDRVFDVHVGDTIDNTYSVDGDSGGQLRLTYKPLNQQQTLPIGGS